MFAKRSTGRAMRRAKAASRVMRSCAIGVLEMLESRMLLSVTRIAAISDYGMANTPESNVAAISHQRRGAGPSGSSSPLS
jgi:hypothetical protein